MGHNCVLVRIIFKTMIESIRWGGNQLLNSLKKGLNAISEIKIIYIHTCFNIINQNLVFHGIVTSFRDNIFKYSLISAEKEHFFALDHSGDKIIDTYTR